MSAPPYQKLFWGSYHKHTSHLRHAADHGAYLLLIGALWNNEGKLPADDETLAGYAKVSVKEWLAMKPRLMGPNLLAISRGKLVQARVVEDLAKYRDTSGKRKEAGKAGGNASARKTKGIGAANATDLPDVCLHNQNHSQIEDNPPSPLEGGDKPSRRKAKRPVPDDFPSAELIAEAQVRAREAGANVDMADQAERLRSWAISKDARYADWSQFWLNWTRKAISEAPRSQVAAAKPQDANDLWRRRVRTFKAERHWNRSEWDGPPGAADCIVPAEVLREFGYEPPGGQGLLIPFDPNARRASA